MVRISKKGKKRNVSPRRPRIQGVATGSKKDHLEKSPITELTPKEEKIKAMLQKGLDKYKNLRFSHLKHLIEKN